MMRKCAVVVLFAVFAGLMAGCYAETTPGPATGSVAIGNPWSDWSTLEEAETAAGIVLGLPEMIADTYTAAHYRTMNGAAKLLEVRYSDGQHEVTLRKAKGEGQDISGVYGHDVVETREWKNGKMVTFCRKREADSEGNSLILQMDHDGCSWSAFAPEGLSEAACDSFLNAIFE